jgi:hypothetical protein
MRSRLTGRPPLAVLALLASASLASADNHKWEIAEVFSSADESVQFIELLNLDKDEHNLAGIQLTTASGSVFVFPSNLPSSATENRRVLIATAAFAAIPGAPTPNYVIPAGFLRRTGDTLTYVSTPDALTFGALPVDGKTSISGTGTALVNSPTNFAGQTGSIRLATAVVRNGSGVNTVCYTSTRPVLGQVWTATIDTTHHAGDYGFVLLFYSEGASGRFRNGFEVLVKRTSVKYFKGGYVSNGGVNTVTMNTPLDPGMIGLFVASQAIILGGPIGREHTNALDLVVGW